MTDAEKVAVTVEEFLSLPETTQPTELIHGEIIVSPAPNSDHQIIAGQIYYKLRQLISGGYVIFSPADVVLGEFVMQPDIFWASDDGQCQKTKKGWQGTPDLVIEILSPSTAKRDREDKYTIYEQHGVREYWIVDPANKTLEIYTLTDGTFKRHGVFARGDTFSSPLLEKDNLSADDILTE